MMGEMADDYNHYDDSREETEYLYVTGVLVHTTELAYLFKDHDGIMAWFPISQSHFMPEERRMYYPDWLVPNWFIDPRREIKAEDEFSD